MGCQCDYSAPRSACRMKLSELVAMRLAESPAHFPHHNQIVLRDSELHTRGPGTTGIDTPSRQSQAGGPGAARLAQTRSGLVTVTDGAEEPGPRGAAIWEAGAPRPSLAHSATRAGRRRYALDAGAVRRPSRPAAREDDSAARSCEGPLPPSRARVQRARARCARGSGALPATPRRAGAAAQPTRRWPASHVAAAFHSP